MDKSKGRFFNIEHIKNYILVVLFFSTMLLLYFFWGSPISKDFKIGNLIGLDQLEIPSFEEITIPGRVVVHMGDGSFLALDDRNPDLWNIFIESLKGLSREEIISVDEITEEQFEKIMDFKSVFFRFHYDIPYEVLTKEYNVVEYTGIEQFGDILLLAYSTGSPESIFIYSNSKNKYYRLVSTIKMDTIDSHLQNIEGVNERSYYRSIGELTGTDNKTVIPLSKESTASKLEYLPEYKDLDSNEVKEFAQGFFGESLDFVRQIKDSKGSKIYMYGYGEKVLTISPNGKVEYKDNETPQGSQQSYLEALDSATTFIAVHGGWSVYEGITMKPYVSSVRQIERDKQKGYRLIFGMEFDGKDIYLENSNSLMIDVIHGQVTQYVRDMITIDESDAEKQNSGHKREAYPAINMLAQNYKYIAGILTETGYDFSLVKEENLFDIINNKIVFVKSGYVRPKKEGSEENQLIPAWVVSTGDVMIFFNLYDAEPLGYTNSFEL